VEQKHRAGGSKKTKKVRDDFQEQSDAVPRGKECTCELLKKPMGGRFEMFFSRC